MKDLNTTSSLLERWIIGLLDALLVGVLVACMVNCYLFQFVFIASAFALGLITVLSVVAWRHGFRWCFSRRALRFYAWLVLGIISVVVLFYAEENWRGKRAWAALQGAALPEMPSTLVRTPGDVFTLRSVMPTCQGQV